MAFSATLETDAIGISQITLVGQLDASMAPAFQAEVAKAALEKPRCLVLRMEALEYMASAGLRALIFAKQKMGPGVDLYVVGAQPQVMDTIRKTGLDRSISTLSSYDAELIAQPYR